MKKLEKILLTAGVLIGVSLVGIGLYKDNKALIYPGLMTGALSAGRLLRPLVDPIDYNPKQKKSKTYKNKKH